MSGAAVATAVRERPILFSGPMVRAILEGRKTQTRRIIRDTGTYAIDETFHGPETAARERKFLALHCPHGAPGDRLWVRETWRIADDTADMIHPESPAAVHYRADPDEVSGGPWRPSIFMPRWASRLTLETTDVRVQRLQEISAEDARAEGIGKLPLQEGVAGAWWSADISAGLSLHSRTPVGAFAKAWDSINGKRAAWASNPWVWAITFRRTE